MLPEITDNEINEYIELYNDCKYYNGLVIDMCDNIIQNFPDYYSKAAKEKFNDIYKTQDIFKSFDQPIFIATYPWSWNYQINYIETLPSIIYYIELKKKYKNLYFNCINCYKDIYSYIFNIFNLDCNYITSLNENLYLKEVYVSTFAKKYFNGCNNLSKNNMLISNIIRDNLTNKFKNQMNDSINKYIYINRENNLAGSNRYIINNTDIINYLNKKIEIITFEKMSLEEKFLSTLNSTIVISPMGANLVNFFYSNNDKIKLFILLVPQVNKHYIQFNLQQLTELGKIDPKIIKIIYCNVTINNLSKDSVNNPYTVNINELDKLISEHIATDQK
jgi:hypothetical protein